MESELEFNEPDGEVKCVDTEYEELSKEHGIRLKEGLYLQELLENKGTIFEPVEQPQEQEPHSNNSYFGDEELVKHLNPSFCAEPNNDDSQDDDDSFDCQTPFESFARKMVDISGGDGGVLKKVIREGTGDGVPAGASVTIHYSAYLEYADEPFDSSELRDEPVRRRLFSTDETSAFIYGLELGIKTMLLKEKAHLLVQPQYAYGPMGCMPRIPGNAVILYEVELLDVLDCNAAIELERLSLEETKELRFERLLAAARSQCAMGTDALKKGSLNRAIKSYLKGTRIMEEASLRDMEDESAQQRLLLRLYLNLALCNLKKNELIKVLTFCNKALEIDKDSSKAHYRRGIAKTKLGEFKAAYDALICAKRLNPNNREINEALLDVDRKKSEMREREKLMYTAMFQGPVGQYDNEAPQSMPAATDESTGRPVDESFCNHVRNQLDLFVNKVNEMEFTFPGELSFHELVALSDIVEEYGLTVRTIEKESSKVIISK